MELDEFATYKLLSYNIHQPTICCWYDTAMQKTMPSGLPVATMTIQHPNTGEIATITIAHKEKKP